MIDICSGNALNGDAVATLVVTPSVPVYSTEVFQLGTQEVACPFAANAHSISHEDAWDAFGLPLASVTHVFSGRWFEIDKRTKRNEWSLKVALVKSLVPCRLIFNDFDIQLMAKVAPSVRPKWARHAAGIKNCMCSLKDGAIAPLSQRVALGTPRRRGILRDRQGFTSRL